MLDRFNVLTREVIRLGLRPPGVFLSGVIITGLLSLLIVLLRGAEIEKTLTGDVSVFLQDQGFERISIKADGRDIVLQGKVSSGSTERIALEYGRSVRGVRTVKSELRFLPLRLPHVLITRGLDYKLSIKGEVSSSAAAENILELIVAKIEHNKVEHLIETSPELIDPHWISVLPAILDEVNQLASLEIEIGAGQAMVGGLINDKSNYRVVIQRLSQFLENSNLVLANGIGILPPRLPATQEEGVENSLKMEEETLVVKVPEEPENTVNVELHLPEQNILDKDVTTNAEVSKGISEEEEVPLELSDSQTLPLAHEQKSKDLYESGSISGSAHLNSMPSEQQSKSQSKMLTKDQCQYELTEIMVAYPVNFSPNKVDFPVDNTITIERIVDLYHKCPTYLITIEGHTDSSGESEVNLRLSQLRAQSVVGRLLTAGIPESRMNAVGFGASSPIADNNTEAGRRKNRRIELKIR